MQLLKNLRPFFSIPKPLLFSHKTPVIIHNIYFSSKELSSSSSKGDDSEWNDAWETAWLPDDNEKLPSTTNADVTFPSSVDVTPTPPADLDSDTKAFVAEMDERWNERKGSSKRKLSASEVNNNTGKSNKKEGDEYRIRKQRIHAGLWMKEIEKMEEARVGSSSCGDDIDKLLDSCSEIFESGNIDLNDSKVSGASELKSKPDGWETTTKNKDGNIWEISQREEDILLQEFERRIAFSKFQIASFIKSHIFSRRRPIDGWKYMIEELGPNARKGKGSVQRLPSLSDSSTQPFTEEIQPNAIPSRLSSHRGR